MSTVYLSRLRLVLPMLVRASGLHVGAAAAAASLRDDLVGGGHLSDHEFNRCYAVARLTPGTNLLALYATLGYQVGAWWGALVSLGIGAVVPTLIAITAAAVYIQYATHPLVAHFMAGASAGAIAVFFWAAVRLVRPAIGDDRVWVLALAVATILVSATGALSPFFVLLFAGGLSMFPLSGQR
jgi:chromate transporter